MIRLDRIIRDYQDSGSLESLINLHAAVDERTFVTKSGHLLTILKADPQDYECLEPAQLDLTARRFEGALRSLDENFRVYQYLLKRSAPWLGGRSYANPVLQRVLARREAYLNERASDLFSIDVFFAIVYTGWQPELSRRAKLARLAAEPQAALRVLSTESAIAELSTGLQHASRVLTQKTDAFAIQLRDVLPLQVLKAPDAFSFLRRLLNYDAEKAETGRLTNSSFVGFQAADSALECYRDHLRLDDYYVRVLTLKEPPARSFPNLLKDLQEIPANYIIASEWKREDNARMRRVIQSKRRHFHNSKSSLLNYVGSSSPNGPKDQLIDDSAVALVDDLGQCLEEIEVKGRSFGQFSLTMVLYDLDRSAVQRASAACFKVFAAHDARGVEERYNQLNAWLAILPGNDRHNLRRMWLLDSNYADLSFLFGQRSGERVNAHLQSEYLAVLETESGTPYFLNLHCQDIGHTIVLGATGSGKSFLLNFLVTHLQKYTHRTLLFDLGGGYERLTRAFQGAYTAVGSTDRMTINPFCLPPTVEDRHFLASFCRVLIESSGYRMTAYDEGDLNEQIDSVYAVEPDQRRLLTLANIVNRNLRTPLQKWVGTGPYARWFDNVADSVTFAPFQTFDFEGIDRYPDVLEPLMFYILHRANVAIHDPALTGQLKVFVLDEAWRFFRHSAIKVYIVEALKTWRKHNAAMILATQSVDDLRTSEILPVVVESCPTELFLANPRMDRDVYREIFHLNSIETERIARLVPKKQVLIKQPGVAKVLNLNVDPETHRLYAGVAAIGDVDLPIARSVSDPLTKTPVTRPVRAAAVKEPSR